MAKGCVSAILLHATFGQQSRFQLQDLIFNFKGISNLGRRRQLRGSMVRRRAVRLGRDLLEQREHARGQQRRRRRDARPGPPLQVGRRRRLQVQDDGALLRARRRREGKRHLQILEEGLSLSLSLTDGGKTGGGSLVTCDPVLSGKEARFRRRRAGGRVVSG